MSDRKLRALIRASSELVRHLNEETVIQKIIHEATGVLEAESCAVILLDQFSDELFFYSATGSHEDALRRIRMPRNVGIVGHVLATGEPVLVEDVSKDPRHYSEVDKETGLTTNSLVCAPLKFGSNVIGAVEAINKKRVKTFDETDLQLLIVFSNFAAVAVNNARAFGRCQADARAFQASADRGEVFLGDSPAIARVWRMIGKVARTDSTVLITGESGSGKEVIASAIHQQSGRRDRPYICVNCAALDTNLLTSELFGHEKGAFTGATTRRAGRFELADTGTLFLDEVADMEPSVQARLLRVLETQRFERLGGGETIHTDARVIAATNTELELAVEQGRFRGDLYHRLNVVSIEIPSLRDRPGDIPGFVEFFARSFSREMRCPLLNFSDDATRLLAGYPWPGNVRELRNSIERLCVLTDEEMVTAAELVDLFPSIRRWAEQEGQAVPSSAHGSSSAAPPESLWEAERQMIEQALLDCNWNQSKAARALAISRHHLRYRIKKYGIRLRPNA
ncbi:MAG: sigma-54-dependent Fis family transcriptional regulator [Lentisphaerae bacterium]|jgi:transcriptional regulator with GAF, ATPase, and Fis domain|nr:sigma-54-dependent Fis family transcriptional regulator [Lentisphaerota bacterium]MBT5609513.1 sigma-54-dependent Fis family transcriptional regulator [Lentisphaerota bacterium]MBT7058489.1 sigma-54-dependent Fis family transcriptional regulator [Lentisphaerota bacterium]MBT7845939.1 sigma-54-dependent Fis family transcriptional regulator [Lentisphaerota bacterium]